MFTLSLISLTISCTQAPKNPILETQPKLSRNEPSTKSASGSKKKKKPRRFKKRQRKMMAQKSLIKEKVMEEASKSSNKLYTGSLFPDFNSDTNFDFSEESFFPIVKIFNKENLKLVIKPGDNQSLARSNRQNLVVVENIAFNLKQLN